MTLGIVLGLLTALGHSLSYLATRWFTVDRGRPVSQLLVQGHVMMGVVSLSSLAWLWPAGFEPTAGWWTQLGGIIAMFIVAQISLLSALRLADASRIAPLLGFKIAVLALISVLQGAPLTGTQWLGVGLAVAAAWVLNDVGGRLPWRVTLLAFMACLAYAVADTFIKGCIDIGREVSGDESAFGVPMFTVAAVFGSLGLIALPLLKIFGSREPVSWRDSAPYAVLWLLSMIALYATFASLGTVLGAILQSARGLTSILLGIALAGLGWQHLEQKHGWAVQARRLGAAALMCLAVVLYVWGVDKS